MYKLVEKITGPCAAGTTLTLPFELRQKSRLLVKLDDGTAAGIWMPRGTILRGGDCLRADDGRTVRVCAAAEPVSTARHDEALILARACYHLGNRHVAVQIGAGWVRYLHDPVLDDMVRALGLALQHESTEFEPEAGAYAPHAHS